MTTQENSQPQQEQQLDTETSLDEATLDGVVGGITDAQLAARTKFAEEKKMRALWEEKPAAKPVTPSPASPQTGGRRA